MPHSPDMSSGVPNNRRSAGGCCRIGPFSSLSKAVDASHPTEGRPARFDLLGKVKLRLSVGSSSSGIVYSLYRLGNCIREKVGLCQLHETLALIESADREKKRKNAHQVVDDLAVPAGIIVAQLTRDACCIDIHRRELLRDSGAPTAAAAETVVLELTRSCRCRVACGMQVRKGIVAADKALHAPYIRVRKENPFSLECKRTDLCARGTTHGLTARAAFVSPAWTKHFNAASAVLVLPLTLEHLYARKRLEGSARRQSALRGGFEREDLALLLVVVRVRRRSRRGE